MHVWTHVRHSLVSLFYLSVWKWCQSHPLALPAVKGTLCFWDSSFKVCLPTAEPFPREESLWVLPLSPAHGYRT